MAIPFTAVFPVLIYNLFPIDSTIVFWVVSILLLIAAFSIVFITGIICIAKAAYNTDKIEKLHALVKLVPVPLFILNFIFLFTFSPMLFPAAIFIIPINGSMCCSAIAISGIIGFQRLRKSEKDGKTIKSIIIFYSLFRCLM